MNEEENAIRVRSEIYNNTDDPIDEIKVTHRLRSNGDFLVSQIDKIGLTPQWKADEPTAVVESNFDNMYEVENPDSYTAEARIKGGWFVDDDWVKASK